MKALTVQQPWVWAIFHGKDAENRTQAWSYRGPLAIHAGARISDRGLASPLVEAAIIANPWRRMVCAEPGAGRPAVATRPVRRQHHGADHHRDQRRRLMARLPVFTVIDETRLAINSTSFFEQATTEWKALLEWCRLHGLNPERMPAVQTIVRDVERCRVVYDAYVVDEDGVRTVNPGSGHMWLSERVHAQGETPPMPFPDVILRHLNQPRETA